MLLLLTFGGLLLLMSPEWEAAAAITGLGGLVAVAWYVLTKHLARSITVDDEGISRIDGDETVRIRWVDIRDVSVGETMIPQRVGTVPMRFAFIQGMGTRRIAFADLTFLEHHPIHVGTPDPLPVSDVADADLLLGLVADRVEETDLLERLEADAEDELAGERDHDAGDEPPAGGATSDTPRVKKKRPSLGVFVLIGKLGAKLIKPLMAMFKGTQGLLVVASAGALTYLFSWQGALALMVLLGVHEYGHVFAMKRSGLKVKGIYFIPLFGAAAVPRDLWRTRSQQAFIALSGPLWGSALIVPALVVVAVTGDRYPLAAAVAMLGAALNLFNLLPISPLDGGRLLAAVFTSISGRLGLALSVAGLVGCAALATLDGLQLIALLVIAGLAELASERSSVQRLRRKSFAHEPERLALPVLLRLRRLVRPGFSEPTETKLRALERERLERQHQLTSITPMTGRQAALWLLAYLGLGGALAAALYWLVTVHQDLEAVLDVFR